MHVDLLNWPFKLNTPKPTPEPFPTFLPSSTSFRGLGAETSTKRESVCWLSLYHKALPVNWLHFYKQRVGITTSLMLENWLSRWPSSRWVWISAFWLTPYVETHQLKPLLYSAGSVMVSESLSLTHTYIHTNSRFCSNKLKSSPGWESEASGFEHSRCASNFPGLWLPKLGTAHIKDS